MSVSERASVRACVPSFVLTAAGDVSKQHMAGMWQQIGVLRQTAIEQQARAERAERLCQNSQNNYSQLVVAIKREREQEENKHEHRKLYAELKVKHETEKLKHEAANKKIKIQLQQQQQALKEMQLLVQDAQRHTLLSRNIWNAAFGSETAASRSAQKRSRSPTLYVLYNFLLKLLRLCRSA